MGARFVRALDVLASMSFVLAFVLACVDDVKLLYTITAGSCRYQVTVGDRRPRQGAKRNMAEETTGRKVLIAIDGSEHGDRAFDCKFISRYRPA